MRVSPVSSLPANGVEPDLDLRQSLRRVLVAWLFGAAWMYIASGAALTQYGKLLHLTPFGFGLLASVPFLAAGIQLPASYWIERYGCRKYAFIWASTMHRFFWVLIGLIPWLCPAPWQRVAFVVLMFLSAALNNIAVPAWMAWMADLIPSRIRARYFSRRIQLGQVVGLVITTLAGAILDWGQVGGGGALLTTISIMFLVAGILGMIDILLFIRVPDLAGGGARPTLSLRELLRAPLASPNYRKYLGYSATMTFATAFVGQFLWLYLFDVVGMSNTRANLLLITVPVLMSLIAYPVWGRVIDRYGSKPVLLLAGILVINGATPWMFITATHWIPAYVFVMLATLAWPGMDLAGFNLILRMTTTREKGSAGTAVIAINSVVTAVAGSVSGLFGGAVMEAIGETWRGSLFGWPLTAHGVLFIISAVLRAVALCWVFGLQERRNVATRDALGYLASDIFTNLQQVIFLPVRGLEHLGRLSYKLPGANRFFGRRQHPRPPK